MSRSPLLSMSLVCLLLLPCLVSADLVNPGFETGDLTGWTAYFQNPGGTASAVTSFTGVTRTYSAPYGTYFAALHSPTGNYTHLYQDVALSAGQVLSGMAALDLAASSGSGNYYARVTLTEEGGQSEIAWSAGHYTGTVLVPFNTSGDWSSWEWTAPKTATYELEYKMYGVFVNGAANGLFDMAAGPSPVIPEPGTLALLAMGLPGLALLRRRRRAE